MSEPEDRLSVRETCQQIMAMRPLFIDTETTGMRLDDQIVELAVVDHEGRVVFQSLVKPTMPIPPKATAVHGITDEMVADAPTFAEIHETVKALLQDRLVVFYNAEYDMRILRQTGRAHGLEHQGPDVEWWCAMLLYAEHRGEWDEYHGNYRWHKLGAAAKACGIAVPADLHRAAADAELTRRLVVWMAGQEGPAVERELCPWCGQPAKSVERDGQAEYVCPNCGEMWMAEQDAPAETVERKEGEDNA
jgi:DNA polymerase-3 subunit epsilon